jgi:hypothetical protein
VLDLGGGRAIGLIVGVIRDEREVQLGVRIRVATARTSMASPASAGLRPGWLIRDWRIRSGPPAERSGRT